MSNSAFNIRFPVSKQFVYEGKTFPGERCSAESLAKCSSFDVRADDICLAAYPRSGSRWTAEVLSWVHHDGDEEKIQATDNFLRCPLIEMIGGGEDSFIPKNTKAQRLYSTHLCSDMAPRNLETMGRMIIVIRNPKDVAVSMFHFYKSHTILGPYEGTWEEFLQGFLKGEVVFGSYFDWIRSWWNVKDKMNALLMKYEEMKREPAENIKKIANFLGKELSDDIIQLIAERTSFKEMQENPLTNFSRHPVYKATFKEDIAEFIRKGKVGDWKNHFTVSQNEKFDKVISQELQGLDLTFEY